MDVQEASAEKGADGHEAVLRAVDAGYRARDYRSFEFVNCEVRRGEVHALLTCRGVDARDFLLAAAGYVTPTEGAVEPVEGDGRRRPLRDVVRCGFIEGVNDVAPSMSVERALACELALAGRPHAVADVLDLASKFLLATHVDMRVGSIDPASRARLGAALACAWEPDVVAVDLASAALPPAEGRRTVEVLRAYAQGHGTAFLVATASPELASAADAVTAMDMDARDLLVAFSEGIA